MHILHMHIYRQQASNIVRRVHAMELTGQHVSKMDECEELIGKSLRKIEEKQNVCEKGTKQANGNGSIAAAEAAKNVFEQFLSIVMCSIFASFPFKLLSTAKTSFPISFDFFPFGCICFLFYFPLFASAERSSKKIIRKKKTRFQFYCTIFHFALFCSVPFFFFRLLSSQFEMISIRFFRWKMFSAAQNISLRTYYNIFGRVYSICVHCFITSNLSKR